MSQKNVRPTWCTHFFDPQLDEFRGSLDPHEKKSSGRTHYPLDVAMPILAKQYLVPPLGGAQNNKARTHLRTGLSIRCRLLKCRDATKLPHGTFIDNHLIEALPNFQPILYLSYTPSSIILTKNRREIIKRIFD